MDTRIVFVKHAWRNTYHRYQATKSKCKRKVDRALMRRIAATLVDVMKEGRP